jgi:protein-S-isoprenylcysteine O-methyltransferase Ste14
MPRFVTRWRVRSGYPLAILFWWLARPTYRSIFLGAAIAILGLLVRAAAAGHLRKSEALTMTGPYAWTRNPLYFGSTLIAGGFIVAGHSLWGALVIAIYFCVFYPAVMRNEEGELQQRYGAAFTDYAKRVPLFFPRSPKPLSASTTELPYGVFSWKQYLRNREYQAALGVLGALLFVWIRMKMRP